MKLRVLRDGPRPGAVNMGLDDGLLRAHRPGDDPVLRLYRWEPACVTYGYHQKPEDFDAAAVAARGWHLVRRPTGGRAILHHQELTYAVVGTSPSPLFGDSLHDSYMTINRALVAFLEGLGLRPDISEGESLAAARGAVCFESAGQHEITVGGRKVVGSAQRRRDGVFLQHGSILTGPAHADLLACLAGGHDTPAARAKLLEATTDLERLQGFAHSAAAYADLEDRLAAACAQAFGVETAES
ncbi:MAG TPA: lipoate--protein ligase family protein [Candidatus Krumholzibacteria bacterium]|nr:lipoate--protein ligase family protein [Candidatus Krumholzibacteria bacterium]HRX50338.1 lipoate--protein ligase family protein [Candidatus Krumholzibacteria bacterium]